MANQLEVKFFDNYNRATELYSNARAKECLPYFKIAIETLIQLVKESYSSEKKAKYREMLDKLLPKYNRIKEEVESQVEVYESKRTQISKEKKVTDSSQPTEEIKTIINGIDVSPFLTGEHDKTIHFDDVKGMDKEIKMIKEEFSNDERSKLLKKELGIKNKNFILFYGVPGTGKTFFATAIANELNVPFVSVSCTQLKGSLHGQTENNVIAIFDYCAQFERCILFLDEFEAIATDRNSMNSSEVASSTVTTLLTKINGFGSSDNILLIGATNLPYKLDGAIISRANEMIEIPLPNHEVILEVLKHKIGDRIANDVDLNQIATRLDGYSNRDISKMINKMKNLVYLKYKDDTSVAASDIKYTLEDLNAAIKEIGPTTKKEDVLRIKQFINEHTQER